jgi:hypothetical protein
VGIKKTQGIGKFMIRTSPTNPPAPDTPAQDIAELHEKLAQLNAAADKLKASLKARKVWMREYMRKRRAKDKAKGEAK